MKLVYSSANALLVSHLRNLVASAGIECQIRNEFLYSAAGELPPTETWPELWVTDEDEQRATAIIDEALSDKPNLAKWQCPACGEWVEGQFGACWRCGRAHDESSG